MQKTSGTKRLSNDTTTDGLGQEKKYEKSQDSSEKTLGFTSIIDVAKILESSGKSSIKVKDYLQYTWWPAFLYSHCTQNTVREEPCKLCTAKHAVGSPCVFVDQTHWDSILKKHSQKAAISYMPSNNNVQAPKKKGDKTDWKKSPGWIPRHISFSGPRRAQCEIGTLIRKILDILEISDDSWVRQVTALGRYKVVTHLVPLLWTNTVEQMETLGGEQLTGSHSCHQNARGGDSCQVHVTAMDLAVQKGYNYCAPCVCWMHNPPCSAAGPQFISALSEKSEEELAVLRQRLYDRARILPGIASLPSGTVTSTLQSSQS